MSRQGEPIKPIIFLAPVRLRHQIDAETKGTGDNVSAWIRDAIRLKLAARSGEAATA